jgi:hypothetical protein
LTGDLEHDQLLMPGHCFRECVIPCPVTDADLLWAKEVLVVSEKCGEPRHLYDDWWSEGAEEQELEESRFTSQEVCLMARGLNCSGVLLNRKCAPEDVCAAKLINIFYWDHPVPDKLSKWTGICVPNAE